MARQAVGRVFASASGAGRTVGCGLDAGRVPGLDRQEHERRPGRVHAFLRDEDLPRPDAPRHRVGQHQGPGTFPGGQPRILEERPVPAEQVEAVVPPVQVGVHQVRVEAVPAIQLAPLLYLVLAGFRAWEDAVGDGREQAQDGHPVGCLALVKAPDAAGLMEHLADSPLMMRPVSVGDPYPGLVDQIVSVGHRACPSPSMASTSLRSRPASSASRPTLMPSSAA